MVPGGTCFHGEERNMRQHKHDSAKVSLFPFLSILVCLIGTLTLTLAISMLSVVDEEELAEVKELRERTEQLNQLGKKILSAKIKTGQLEKLLKEELAKKNALASEAQKLTEATKHAKAKRKANDAQQAKLNELKGMDAALLNQYLDIADSGESFSKAMEMLRHSLNDLGIQLKDIKERHTQLTKHKPGENISILSGGSGRGRKPVFVECTVTSVIQLPSGKRLSLEGKSPASGLLAFLIPSKKSSFEEYLHEIKENPGKTLVFLIRPGATSTFKKAFAMAKKTGVQAGYLPLPSGAPVNIVAASNDK